MRNSRLEPCFLSRSLREPWPDCRYVEQAQVLKQNAPTESQGLYDKVIEEVVGRFREVSGQNGGDISGILDNRGDDIYYARRDCGE